MGKKNKIEFIGTKVEEKTVKVKVDFASGPLVLPSLSEDNLTFATLAEIAAGDQRTMVTLLELARTTPDADTREIIDILPSSYVEELLQAWQEASDNTVSKSD